MDYGANGLRWAPFADSNPEPADALPNYGKPMTLGELNKVTVTPSFAEASAAGNNNAMARYIRRFQQATVDVEMLDMLNEVASSIFGAKLDSQESAKNLHFNAGDKPPYGGLAFYTENLMAGNVTKFQGIFIPKLKANMQGKEYNTTGTSIILANAKAQFMAMQCAMGDWMILSDFFATEAEAKAWVETMLPDVS